MSLILFTNQIVGINFLDHHNLCVFIELAISILDGNFNIIVFMHFNSIVDLQLSLQHGDLLLVCGV